MKRFEQGIAEMDASGVLNAMIESDDNFDLNESFVESSDSE